MEATPHKEPPPKPPDYFLNKAVVLNDTSTQMDEGKHKGKTIAELASMHFGESNTSSCNAQTVDNLSKEALCLENDFRNTNELKEESYYESGDNNVLQKDPLEKVEIKHERTIVEMAAIYLGTTKEKPQVEEEDHKESFYESYYNNMIQEEYARCEELMNDDDLSIREMYCQIIKCAKKLCSSYKMICPHCMTARHLGFQCSNAYNESLVSYKNGDATSEILEYVLYEGAHELLETILVLMMRGDSFYLQMAHITTRYIVERCYEFGDTNMIQETPLEKNEVPPQEEDEHEEELLILEDMQLLDMWEQVDYCSGNLSSSFEGMRQYNDKPNELYDYECIPLFKEFLSSNTHINGNNVKLLEYIVYDREFSSPRVTHLILPRCFQ